MQKGNPMKGSLAGNATLESTVDHILHDSEPKLAPAPSPSKPPIGKSYFGRTIEVQTDLSMVTME